MNKILAGFALAAGVGLASTPASAVVVSNIDFGVLAGGVHLETMNLAEQFLNPATTPAGTGDGWGYGRVNEVNGDTTYCGVGACTLYYTVHFTGGTFISPTQISFTGTDVTIYYDPSAPVNLLTHDSVFNLAFIQGLTAYATLSGHGNLGGGLPAGVVSFSEGLLSGATLALVGHGLLDVNSGDGIGDAAFEAFLDGNGIPDSLGGGADIEYNESASNAVLNPLDVSHGLSNGCRAGTAATGAWCWQGTLNTRGLVAVPEPDTLALLSLSLMLGGAFSFRRRRES